MSRIHDALERARRERKKPEATVTADAPPIPQRATVERYVLPELAEVFSQECDRLRSAIELALADRPNKVVMFTSAVRREGCTTLVASLGYALASRGGARVTLVDANIEQPGLSRLMGLGTQAGLTDIVGRELDLQSALRSTPTANLHVLLAGNTPLIYSEVFGSSRTSAVIDRLKQHHQYVLIDAPAVMPVPEAARQAREADGVVLVTRANKTDRTIIAKAKDLLLENDANLLGVVLNRRRFVIPEFLYRRL